MRVFSSNEIRNVAVIGHSGCGKTSLVEAFLSLSGATKRLGRVDEGNTVSDYDPEEIRRRISIGSSIVPIEWMGGKINFIDTPGSFDFVGQIKEALSVADLLLIVVSAKSGVEVGTEIAWEYAEEMGLPRMLFINGMDDENADLDHAVEDLKQKFGKSIAPIQLPIKEAGKFVGYINVVKRVGRKFVDGKVQDYEIPSDLVDTMEIMRHMAEEAVAETDDALIEKYFEEESFTVDEIYTGIQQGVAAHIVTPVLCGSATYNIGVTGLLDAIVNSTPPTNKMSPIRKGLVNGTTKDIECSADAPLALYVFKTIADPYVGRLSIFKVVSGTLRKDTQLYNSNKDTTERATQPLVLRGKEQIEVLELRAGDIGAMVKLQSAATGHSLCIASRPVSFAPVSYPEALLQMSIAPKNKGDEDKIGQAMSKMLEEDKTLRFSLNSETKQAVVSAIGDNQLDVLVNRLRSRYKLEVELQPPTLQYREMIRAKIRVQGRHKKQSGGSGQYGDVHMEFEPSGDLTIPYIFEEKIFGGSVPKQYFPAVEKGLADCVKAGPMAGYPVVGIKATLVDGSYHAVDSSEVAFKLAATIAFKEAFMKAQPAILEPIARLVITVPDQYTGDIMGDMSKRRGRIIGTERLGAKTNITAEVPMAEVLKYTTDLRSMTQGRGIYTLSFERYEQAPADIQAKVINARKGA